jgi:AcrR family transcriptional regulator
LDFQTSAGRSEQMVSDPPRRAGRPRKAESAEIDARILDAAFAIFSAQGFDAASMEAVAARAGITRMTLYQRHADKLALFRAVITERGNSWQQVSERTVWMAGDTLEVRLKHFARTVIQWSHNPEVGAARNLSCGAQGVAGKVAAELEQAFRHKMAEMLALDIADYAAREGRDLHDPHEAARFLIGMIEAIARAGKGTGQTLGEQEAAAGRAVMVLLHGIGD